MASIVAERAHKKGPRGDTEQEIYEGLAFSLITYAHAAQFKFMRIHCNTQCTPFRPFCRFVAHCYIHFSKSLSAHVATPLRREEAVYSLLNIVVATCRDKCPFGSSNCRSLLYSSLCSCQRKWKVIFFTMRLHRMLQIKVSLHLLRLRETSYFVPPKSRGNISLSLLVCFQN